MKNLLGPFLVLLAGTAAAWVLRMNARPLKLLGGGNPLEAETSPSPWSASFPRGPMARPARTLVKTSLPRPAPRPTLQPHTPYLSGRILDTRGRPQARKIWRFTFFRRLPGGAPAAKLVPAGTDGEGRFLVPFPGGNGDEEEVILRIRPMARDGGNTGTAAARKVLLSRYPPGITSLGDLVLREEPLLAAGRVIDPSGNPLKGIEVRAWAEIPGPSRADRRGLPASPGTWIPLPFFSRTAKDGTFKIRGQCDASLLQLRTTGKNWFQEDPPILSPGSTGLCLILSPGGRIEGKLLPPDAAVPRDFLVLLRPSAWEGRAKACLRSFPEEDGRFSIQGIPPGRAVLEVLGFLDGRKLLEIHGLEIPAGRICPDPRVRTLDLSEGGGSFELILEDSSRRPVGEGLALAGVTQARIYRCRGGVLHLPALLKGKTLYLWAPGFRVRRLDHIPEDRKVRLEKGLPLRLVLDPALPAPDPPLQLWIHVSLDPGWEDTAKAAALFLGLSGLPPKAPSAKGRLVEFLLPSPGSYILGWGIGWNEGLRGRILRPPPEKGFLRIHVPEQGGEGPLPRTLRPSRGAYLSLLKKAREAYASSHEK